MIWHGRLSLPSFIPDIPKFEGNNSEDPGEHVTNFHLWFSWNSLSHDSVFLWLFQCTLMGHAEKWYIEFPRGTYRTFNDLSMMTRMVMMLGGTRSLNIRISSLVIFVGIPPHLLVPSYQWSLKVNCTETSSVKRSFTAQSKYEFEDHGICRFLWWASKSSKQ